MLADRLTTTHPDVLRELLSTFIHILMGADADALCGTGYGKRSAERTILRNGYRVPPIRHPHRVIGFGHPDAAAGSVFPGLAANAARAERALTTVVATCYLLGLADSRQPQSPHRGVARNDCVSSSDLAPAVGTDFGPTLVSWLVCVGWWFCWCVGGRTGCRFR